MTLQSNMEKSLILLSISLSVFYIEVNCQAQCSSGIGSNNETELTAVPVRVTTPSFFLNTDYPASCSGTVTRWRFCFYKPAMHNDGDRYRLSLAVYRPIGSGNSTQYEIVESSLRTITRMFQPANSTSNFICQNLNLQAANRTSFDIEVGDIAGVCIFNPTDSTIEPMHIISEANGYSLLQNNIPVQCSFNSVSSVNISSSELTRVESRLLHLSAEPLIPATSPPTTTTMSTTTVSTTELTASTMPSTSIPSINDTTTTEDMVTTSEITTMTSTSITSVNNLTTQTSTTVSEIPMGSTSTESASIMTQTDATPESTITTSSRTTGTMAGTATTTQANQRTTSDSGDSSTSQATPIVDTTMSTDDDGAISSDTTVTQDDSSSSTIIIAHTSAESSGTLDFAIIIGVVVAVILLAISGIAIFTIIAIVVKKRGKSVGTYSLPNNSDSTLNISNGVDNATYGMGFHNPGATDTRGGVYDDLTRSANTGEGNYFELAASGLSNTYESVTAGVYSELSVAYSTTDDTKLQQTDDQNSNLRGDGNCYELEYEYSSLENFNTNFSLLLEKNKQEDIYGNLEAYYAPASNENEIYSQLKSCGTNNIPHVQIEIMGHLGSGQFGNVEKGMWRRKEVALKTLKTDTTHEDKVKFLQEAAIMAQFKHPNIVNLHGVASDKEPLMLVVEMMHRGDLRDHLHSLRPDPGELPLADLPQMLLSFSQHVALGMQYLSGKGFVHRDLAARNILVSKDNICKVADFGMSRDLADETYYVSRGGMIPVKWTALEAIHYRKYSTASDVWSYGCLLYEIWSLGYKPFEGMANEEVVKILDSNKRLSPPPGCPRTIYELMIKCWDPTAGSRPKFRELTIILTGNPQEVLSIPQEALDSHELAGVLGSPLEIGKNTYKDLQDKYCSEYNVYD